MTPEARTTPTTLPEAIGNLCHRDPTRAAESAAASGALAAAFEPDPMMVYLAPDPARRRRMLPPYFAAVLRQAGRVGRIRVASDGRTVVGAVAAMPPGTYPLPVLPQLTEWRAMRAAGAWSTLRNFRDLPRIDAARPDEPHWYVMYLGVHPSAQGSGYGAALLDAVLANADADARPTYLVTMREANLDWYRRFGFEVRSQLRLGRNGPPAWSMLRTTHGPERALTVSTPAADSGT